MRAPRAASPSRRTPAAAAAHGGGRGARAAAAVSKRRKIVRSGWTWQQSKSNPPALRALAEEKGEREDTAAAGALLDAAGVSADAIRDPDTGFLSFVVLGASGDLAKRKIIPALFALYYEGLLPENFVVMGYARTAMSVEDFRDSLESRLTCRISAGKSCGPKMEEFLNKCFYCNGGYDSRESFESLAVALQAHEDASACESSNRIFYMSVPPSVFLPAAKCASLHASSPNGWTRVIVEKPFGRDSESSAELNSGLTKYLTEEQIYRIDHYLGKELVENLIVLRFANLVFEPLWCRQYIKSVQIIFSENFGTEGRGGYFDNYGIIRDIIQNHLLQVLALFAMEPPVSLDAEQIRNEKVKVLRSMRELKLEDVVVGQYTGRVTDAAKMPGYLDDPTVPEGSTVPTFAAVALFVDNARWDGVPFLIKAGKALDRRLAEIRVQFNSVPGNVYKEHLPKDKSGGGNNELVIRIQPEEAITLKINNKFPGLGLTIDQSKLDLQYKQDYDGKEFPDAYERLILDVVNGDKRLFIRGDELEAAWDIFTPALHRIDDGELPPEAYPYGSRGPLGAHYLAAKYGVMWKG